jgi:hypothetical protein
MITVKIVSCAGEGLWLRQFPENRPQWGSCRFIFAPDATDYDWLFVYDELSNDNGKMKSVACHCNKQNTILLTVEPPNIKSYGRAYTKQFGWVLTSQPQWALHHPGRIYSQPALLWFYGLNSGVCYDTMKSKIPSNKTKIISTVCSSKKQWHTLHHKRFYFTQKMKSSLPELEVFGHGVKTVFDKSQALDDYKYHIAVENYIGKHHWTKKLADAFLGATLPFYAGCPNAADYFPAESFIPIDIYNPKKAAAIIRKAIEDNEYEKRLPYILEARRLVLEEYNLFAVLSNEIQARHQVLHKPDNPAMMLSRRMLRKRLDIALVDLYDKIRLKIISICNLIYRL